LEYYSATKQNKIPLFVGKPMEIDIIVLSKLNQIQKNTYCMFFSHTWGILNLKKDDLKAVDGLPGKG
jgi:hypothetical protein